MGRITLLPDEPKTEDALRQTAVEQSMPVNCMADFSVLGILVDRLPEAMRLLEEHRFDIVWQNRCTQIVTNGPEQIRRLFHILDSEGFVFRFTDLTDGIYQG